ncbi:hypothetical protein GCM10010497_59350 [Streptomyces cinereoruber]|uniref:Uncharacterized protein n=1 Tax=Streptomyces cinereoruber TaxID=67260 RepID=A0AAV4KQK4_9ACTN|nr:hypothetical protein [Streptomyces cinereoruber]NIH65403.1 hypothetical protein [Streptomyces cinereoruber]GGR48109.1 hypothetical protein GCM10010497_59350 [Streptomyces cinereoruber]
MMPSLDWAGRAPVIAAVAQTAAVVVQAHRDRRPHGASTRRPAFGHPGPVYADDPAHGSVRVQTGTLRPFSIAASVTVQAGKGSGMDGQAVPAVKEHGPW